MSRSIRPFLLSCVAFFSGAAALADDGASLFRERCAACHGVNGGGNATLLAPPLAGHDEAYLVRQLQLFRSGRRGGDTPSAAVSGMQSVARALPDEAAIAAVARHAARLRPPAVKAAPPVAGSPQMAGKATYSVCMGCHGGHGEGNLPLGAPRLNHLPAWYTVAQLKAYRGDQRGTHIDDKPGQQMRQVAKEALADDEAAQVVAEFIATLGTGRR